jgi:hypothetical protein
MYSRLTQNGLLPRSVVRYAIRHAKAILGWSAVGAVPGLEDMGFLRREQTTNRRHLAVPAPLGYIGESPSEDLSSMSATVLPAGAHVYLYREPPEAVRAPACEGSAPSATR